MSEWPDGLYDALLDKATKEQFEPLLVAGQATCQHLTEVEHRQYLASALGRCLADLFDALPAHEGGREGTELAVIQRLLTHLRAAGAELPVWESPLQTLRAIHRRGLTPTSPVTGLRAPWLFTASKAEFQRYSVLRG